MYDRTLENRLHLFENITADNHDTIYELLGAFYDLCKILSQKEVLTDGEFDDIVNKRRYKPTGESAPVVHAHWILYDDNKDIWDCSNCKTHIFINVLYGNKAKYCPNCGAIMDADDTQETHKD